MNKKKTIFRALCCGASVLLVPVTPPMAGDDNHTISPSSGDWGGIGILQMPNARFRKEGGASLGVTSVNPYFHGYLSVQGVPWAEGTIRYTTPEKVSGNVPGSKYRDRGVDLKFRLLEESAALPQIALGLRDIGGNAFFSSEYLVASKRYYNWDFTGGIAWGNAGTRGHFNNPLGYLHDGFNTRPEKNSWGQLSTAMFRGKNVAFFGGVEVQTSIEGLKLKAEYDGNNYKNDPFAGVTGIKSSSPLNFGVEYALQPWINLAAGFERGNTVMLRSSINFSFDEKIDVKPKKKPLAVTPRSRAIPVSTAPGQFGVFTPSGVGKKMAVPVQVETAIGTLFSDFDNADMAVLDIEINGAVATITLNIDANQPTDIELADVALAFANNGNIGIIENVAFIAMAENRQVAATSFNIKDLARSKNLTGSPLALNVRPGKQWQAALAAVKPQSEKQPSLMELVFDGLEGEQLGALDVSFNKNNINIVLDTFEKPSDRATMDRVVRFLRRKGGDKVQTVSFVIKSAIAESAQYDFRPGDKALPRDAKKILASSNVTAPQYVPQYTKEAIRTAAKAVFGELKDQDLIGESLDLQGRTAVLHVSNDSLYRNAALATGRAGRILARNTPAEIEQFKIILSSEGIPITEVSLLRSDLEKAVTHKSSPEEIWQNTRIDDGSAETSPTAFDNEARFPAFSWGLQPRFRQIFGGAKVFYAYQGWLDLNAKLSLAPGLSVNGSVGRNLHNTFDKLDNQAKSTMPHVRSDAVKYLQGSDTWIDQLYVNAWGKLAPNLYGRASGGLLEMMYGGASGEILYRQPEADWAVGLEASQVFQRDYQGGIGFLGYNVFTSHLSYYQEIPYYDMLGTVHVGRYLAGDSGVTVDLSRGFENGSRIGVFATKTNVSAREFGEGSFDKGIYFSVPLDSIVGRPSKTAFNTTYRPVSRDGGQRLASPYRLYDMTDGYAAKQVSYGWKNVLD